MRPSLATSSYVTYPHAKQIQGRLRDVRRARDEGGGVSRSLPGVLSLRYELLRW